jgi:hypothetical protein
MLMADERTVVCCMCRMAVERIVVCCICWMPESRVLYMRRVVIPDCYKGL